MNAPVTNHAPDTFELEHADTSIPVISFDDVSKRYGSTHALNNINLDILPGQIIALVGPNGAGKSTLVETIMGLRTADSGTVKVFNVDIAKHPKSHLKRIGVQLQETKVFPKLSGREYLNFFEKLYDNPLSVDAVIEQLDMQTFIDKPLDKVSGGQKQRVALALSIINDPDLIILDEPTVGLDPIARKEFWRFIRNLQSDGKTLLFTTHYMEEAQALASQVVMLAKGRIVAAGSPQHIVDSCQHIASATLDDAYTYLVEQSQGALA